MNLYILTVANFVEVLHKIDLFKAECENTTVHMTFSSDSTSLLLCVQDFKHAPLCFVLKGNLDQGILGHKHFSL